MKRSAQRFDSQIEQHEVKVLTESRSIAFQNCLFRNDSGNIAITMNDNTQISRFFIRDGIGYDCRHSQHESAAKLRDSIEDGSTLCLILGSNDSGDV